MVIRSPTILPNVFLLHKFFEALDNNIALFWYRRLVWITRNHRFAICTPVFVWQWLVTWKGLSPRSASHTQHQRWWQSLSDIPLKDCLRQEGCSWVWRSVWTRVYTWKHLPLTSHCHPHMSNSICVSKENGAICNFTHRFWRANEIYARDLSSKLNIHTRGHN